MMDREKRGGKETERTREGERGKLTMSGLDMQLKQSREVQRERRRRCRQMLEE
jgi:hypothetical protein